MLLLLAAPLWPGRLLAETRDTAVPPATLMRLEKLTGPERVQELLQLSRGVFRQDPPLCREYLRQALVQAREINDYRGVAQAYNGLGAVANTLGEYEEGQTFFRQALQRFELLEDAEGQAKTLQNIALTQAMLGMYEEAATTNRRALALRRELGDSQAIAHSLNALATNHRDLRDLPRALACSQEALELTDPERNPLLYRRILVTLGTIHSELDQPDQALGFLEAAERLVREAGTPYDLGFLLGNMGLARLNLGQVESALACGQEALGLGEELQNPTISRYAHQILARVYEEQGQAALALTHLQQEMAYKDELFSDRMLQRVGDLTARLESSRLSNTRLEEENRRMEQELARERARGQRRVLILVLGLSLLGGLIAVSLLQKARRAQRRLARQTARLNRAMDQLNAQHRNTDDLASPTTRSEFREFHHGKADLRNVSGF